MSTGERDGELNTQNDLQKFKVGYVCILGRPNVGKSTLLNLYLGFKLSIVTSKPQTTRTNLYGVLNLPNAQIAFIDTPGYHEPVTVMGKRMVEHARSATADADILLIMFDATTNLKDEDLILIDMVNVKYPNKPRIVALNKVDKIKDKRELLPRMEELAEILNTHHVVPISALQAINTDKLLDLIVELLPEGEPLFPIDKETINLVDTKFWVSELIREKIMRLTKQEVPYKVGVEIDELKDKGEVVYIRATIYVEREGQKKILIGKGGKLIKTIGTYAREELELFFRKKVYLELWVKVKPKWTLKEDFMKAMGY